MCVASGNSLATHRQAVVNKIHLIFGRITESSEKSIARKTMPNKCGAGIIPCAQSVCANQFRQFVYIEPLAARDALILMEYYLNRILS